MRFKLTTPQEKQAVKSYIDSLSDEKQYNIEITLKARKRTLPSNRLYWLWLACLSQETGNDKDDLHDFFKQKFIGYQTKEFRETTIYKEPSTASLSTVQFSSYLDKICAFAGSELGVVLPCPADLIFEQFYQQYNNHI